MKTDIYIKISGLILVVSMLLAPVSARADYLTSYLPGMSGVFGGGVFGGQIEKVQPCTCSGGTLIHVGPPRSGSFLFTSGSEMYKHYQVYRPGVWVLGDYNSGGGCSTESSGTSASFAQLNMLPSFSLGGGILGGTAGGALNSGVRSGIASGLGIGSDSGSLESVLGDGLNRDAFNTFDLGTAGGAGSTVADSLVSDLDGVTGGAVSGITGTVSDIQGGIADIQGSVSGAVDDAVGAATGFADDLTGGAVSGISDAYSGIQGGIADAQGAITEGVSGAVGEVVGGLDTLTGGFAGDFAGSVSDAFGNIGSTFSGIPGGLGTITSLASGDISGIASNLLGYGLGLGPVGGIVIGAVLGGLGFGGDDCWNESVTGTVRQIGTSLY